MKPLEEEPLAKLMSGDLLPHFGPFPSLNFAPWNHHADHSIPNMVSKWDCRSSTQSFARGSEKKIILQSVENREWKQVLYFKHEAERFRKAAQATLKKDKRVNIRMTERNLVHPQKKAMREGLPLSNPDVKRSTQVHQRQTH